MMKLTTNTTNATLLKKQYLNLRIVIFLVVIFVVVNSIQNLGTLSQSERDGITISNDESTNNELKRPVIYTFFEQNKDKLKEKDIDENKEMVEFWKKSWYEAGWDPIIITLEDAKRHPDFEKNTAILMELKITDYDVLCFQRWMAMAVVGGGFMADYDFYPLHKQVKKGLPLPNNGKFTNYDPNPKAGVPSFQSGSAEEWSRMTDEIMKYVPRHKGEFYSDMFAMREFHLENPGSFARCPKVANHVMMTPERNIDCEKYNGLIGIHLSHQAFEQAMQNGIFDEIAGAKSRTAYAQRFLGRFRNECTDYGKDIFLNLAHIYWQTEFPFDEVEIDESLMS